MTNRQIASQFGLLADLMSLHDEEDFRFKSYGFASRALKAAEGELSQMSLDQLKSIKGVGDAIAQKVLEIQKNGEFKMLATYKERTPSGVLQLLEVNGLGAGTVKKLWTELGVESPGELLYACQENRVAMLKGFGAKKQEKMIDDLQFFMKATGKARFHQVEEMANTLVEDLQMATGSMKISLTGEIRRGMPIVVAIEILAATTAQAVADAGLLEELDHENEGTLVGKTSTGFPVRIYLCPEEWFGLVLLQTTGNPAFVEEMLKGQSDKQFSRKSEAEIFEQVGLPFIPAEAREGSKVIFKTKLEGGLPLVKLSDIKGVIHAHSTWSDGGASLRDMALACRNQGYGYLGITDHSKSAVYANGLSPERVLAQMEEIDTINAELAPFKIFKGIESDILMDGSLDYDAAILSKFDFIIASVHFQLRMDEAKATDRLIKAIENPYTTILGHPTGRLLLGREGYPINHTLVIEACAKHKVAIELNANPNRLDIDWKWIGLCMELNVPIFINPDAHSTQGIKDLRYGVLAARKGLLSVEACPNCLSADAFAEWLRTRKR